MLVVAHDVLEHHDRVVDDDPDRERKPQQREGVDREAEEVQDDERADERRRNREEHVERRRERAEKEIADDRGQERRQRQREDQLVRALVDELGRVDDRRELHVLGSSGTRSRHLAS